MLASLNLPIKAGELPAYTRPDESCIGLWSHDRAAWLRIRLPGTRRCVCASPHEMRECEHIDRRRRQLRNGDRQPVAQKADKRNGLAFACADSRCHYVGRGSDKCRVATERRTEHHADEHCK